MKKGLLLQLKRYAAIVFGVLLVAFAISVFYTPNKIVSGGVSGISTILFHTFGIQPGVSFAVINIVLLILAWKFLGFSFVKDTLLGAALLSVFVQVFTYVPPVTSDVFLAAVFGSVLYGVGIGLTLIEGASTGGTDILSRLVQCAFPHVKIGNLLMVVDASVILLSLVVFRTFDLALYGIIALFLASFAINLLISKLNVSKLAFVVSDKGVEISQFLVSHSPRGVTIIDSVGAYTMEKRKVLMCALKENELPRFQEEVLKIDGSAFIIYSESQTIVGNGFRVYK
jgi:uncharacterized membrane-anchored protein YitT (DUF2179 family)